MSSDQENPVWNESHLKHRFVYNSFEPSESIRPQNVSIWFFSARDCDIFELTVNSRTEIFVSVSDLKELRFPKGARSPFFFGKDLAIFKDKDSNWFIHNPISNETVGNFDIEKLE